MMIAWYFARALAKQPDAATPFIREQPDALKIKPIVMMDAGYFDLNERVGSAFKAGNDYVS